MMADFGQSVSPSAASAAAAAAAAAAAGAAAATTATTVAAVNPNAIAPSAAVAHLFGPFHYIVQEQAKSMVAIQVRDASAISQAHLALITGYAFLDYFLPTIRLAAFLFYSIL